MKIRRYPKACCWTIVLLIILFSMTLYSCRRGQTRPEPAPSAPAPAPSEPAPAPSKPTPSKPTPSKQPSPPPSRPAAPQPKEVAPSPSEQTLPEETYFTHTVKWSGETLFIIAAWYTGDRENWRGISEAMTRENPNANIHLIRRGDKIPVPESLMKTRDPMPKEFVDNFYTTSKPEKPPSKPAPAQKEEEEPKLFGPKDPSKK